ncbi:unnamed protein product [Sphagnum jensenii]|uniref:Uncharacterized protein n=1 Tax=Sphagnum jensenii TaxID=128206 RepID=A0ABP0VNY1_9BRYO
MYITPNRKPSGHRDRGSDILRGPQSSPSDVCRHDNVRESETRPLARRLPPAEDDDKFRDRTVMYSTVCGTTPKKRTTNSVTDSLP